MKRSAPRWVVVIRIGTTQTLAWGSTWRDPVRPMGAPAAVLFALLHGAGNGLLTIARGTVPLAVFGPIGYGARTGLLGAPARAAQAAAPLLFGVLLDELGKYALIVSGGLSVLALIALLSLRAKSPHPD